MRGANLLIQISGRGQKVQDKRRLEGLSCQVRSIYPKPQLWFLVHKPTYPFCLGSRLTRGCFLPGSSFQPAEGQGCFPGSLPGGKNSCPFVSCRDSGLTCWVESLSGNRILSQTPLEPTDHGAAERRMFLRHFLSV